MAATKLHLTDKPPKVKQFEESVAGDLLSVDQARELVHSSRRRPFQGDSTVIHITGGHLVRDNVWNVLLKMLEEPPPYVHVHIYANSTDAIPGTIKSRAHTTRESMTFRPTEDASRFARLWKTADIATIAREADRHTGKLETVTALENLTAYCIEEGLLEAVPEVELARSRVARGANTRVCMKAMLCSLAISHRRAEAATA